VVNGRNQAWLLKNSFQGILPTKFVRKLLKSNLWDERSDAADLRLTRDVLDASNNSTVTRSGFGER
jgi:hypothetical protein